MNKVDVLTKIQNEEITIEQGAKMLEDLEKGLEIESTTQEPVNETLKTNPVEKGKTFRIRVLSNDGDKVNIQIPLGFAKSFLKVSGQTLIQKSNLDIDFVELIEMIENGNLGKLIDIESADGDIVEISID